MNCIFVRCLAATWLAVVTIGATTIANADAPQFVLVEPKGEPVPIVVFADAPPRTRGAAVELADYVEKICGRRPEVLDGEPRPSGGGGVSQTAFDLPVPPAVGRVRRADPATSRAAAAAVAPDGPLIQRVAQVLRGHPRGLADFELLALLGLPERRRGSVIKRRGDLGAVPVVDDDGRPVTRPNDDGRPCQVWTLR